MPANRLLKSEALSGITTYTYDASGNRRTVEEPSGDLTTSTWDAQNHLVQVELPTSEIVTYTWAPINKANEERLVQRDDGVDIRRYLWDNNNVLRETDDLGAVQTQYACAALWRPHQQAPGRRQHVPPIRRWPAPPDQTKFCPQTRPMKVEPGLARNSKTSDRPPVVVSVGTVPPGH